MAKPNKKVKDPSIGLNWYRNVYFRDNNIAKKKFKALIKDQIDSIDPIKGRVKISYRYYAKKNGTDLSNFVTVVKKYFEDALVESGVIEGDTCAFIVENNEKFIEVDKSNPRVEATVTILD